MKKLNFPRLLFSGAVAFSALVAVARSYFLSFWHFNILSATHWNLILQKWNAGWVLHKTGEYVFLCSLLAAPFVLAALWCVCYKIRWAKLLSAPLVPIKNRQKKALEKKSLQAAVGNPADLKKAPAPKHSAPKIPEKLRRLRGTPVAPAMQASAPQTVQPDTGAARKSETFSRIGLWNRLAAELEAAGVYVLRELTVFQCNISILAVTRDGLFMFCEGPSTGSVWTADETAEKPFWKTEDGTVFDSPLHALLHARKEFRKLIAETAPVYADIPVNGCLFLDHGRIDNINDVLTFLSEVDLSILRTGSCRMSELPDTNALTDYIKSLSKSDQRLNDAVAYSVVGLMTPPLD